MADGLELNLAGVDDKAIRAFLRDLYHIFLKREPDSIGLEAHLGALRAGMRLSELIRAFADSQEHMQLLIQKDRWSPDLSERVSDDFPADYRPPGEAGGSYLHRRRSGFLDRYCSGPVVLDVGFSGYNNPEGKTGLPKAIGIDLDYPGYDGIRLPFDDGAVDCVFSSHCLEHILFDHAAIRDWYRVLKIGGFIVCMVPSQALYEKRRFLPSQFNADHKRMYTPSSLALSFETALETNSYRVRHLAENDRGFDYTRGPELHSGGCYEIEIVIEKISSPAWTLAA